ncbi:MAG: universal stress protein [Kiloniellales bacterium]
MTYATILAVVDGTEGGEAALGAALALGERMKSRVELLHVEIDAEASVPVLGEGMSGAVVEQVIESLRSGAQQRLTRARQLYQDRVVDRGVATAGPTAKPIAGQFTVVFDHAVGREADEVARRGRLADLIVIGRPSPEGDGVLSPSLDAALFDSGRPVLLVPPGQTAEFGKTVAIGWDRSREAARAAAVALPLLERAESVTVLTAREDDSGTEPSQLVKFLNGHGIEARTWAFVPDSGRIGEALLEQAGKAGADLLVMGAYSHSRLRELVLGGATRSVLRHATLPVLMAH